MTATWTTTAWRLPAVDQGVFRCDTEACVRLATIGLTGVSSFRDRRYTARCDACARGMCERLGIAFPGRAL